MKNILSIVLVLMSVSVATGDIRINQVGYLADEPKRAVIGENRELQGKVFSVRNISSGQIVHSGSVGTSVSGWGDDTPFMFNYVIDFTPVQLSGAYRIELSNGDASHDFRIGNDVYSNVIDTLLHFLRAARCGNTNPELHKPCHLSDATNTDLDLTGGWHDAGDFLKFTRQEAYTAYLLLLSYDVGKENYKKYFSDRDKNGMADVLDEAKIGLDYLEKCYPDENTFVHRVGDFDADHDQKFRLPENDRLAARNRPALFGADREKLAKYAYTMALASSIFSDIEGYTAKGQKYLALAKRAFEKAKLSDSGHDAKLCLAAVELYLATGESDYLVEARHHNDKLSTSDMGNYFNNINLAHARLAPFYAEAAAKLEQSVSNFHSVSMNNLFGFNVKYVWGSLYVSLSSGSAGWLYQTISENSQYEALQRRIKDYTLGLNPWGVCFISGLGTVYPKNIHNRLAYSLKKAGVLQEGTITGAVAEGPINRSEWQTKWRRLVPKRKDALAEFQTKASLYHDNVGDYVTNEPCIYGAAEAILFFSFYLKYLTDADSAGLDSHPDQNRIQ